jgi:hypothetical protein
MPARLIRKDGMSEDKDRYRPRTIEDPAVSLINEMPEYRDRGDTTVLHRWPKERPLRTVLGDAPEGLLPTGAL